VLGFDRRWEPEGGILKLVLGQEYKSLNPFSTECSSSLVVVAGPNGSGKSHFLESLFERQCQIHGIGEYRPLKVALGAINNQNGNVVAQHSFQFSGDRQVYLEGLLSNFDLADPQRSGMDQEAAEIIRQQLKERKIRSLQEGLDVVPGHHTLRFAYLDQPNNLGHAEALYGVLKSRFRDNFAGDPKSTTLADVESAFTERYGPAPSEQVQELLRGIGASFEVAKLSPTRSPVEIKFRPKGSKSWLKREDLSGGERLQIDLATSIFFARSGTISNSSVLLIDEGDAPLHPTLIKVYLQSLVGMLAENMFKAAFVTTHSPILVVLTPQPSLFTIDPLDRVLRESVNEDVLGEMTKGLPDLRVSNSATRIVFCEGKDAPIFSHLLTMAQSQDLEQFDQRFVSPGADKAVNRETILQVMNAINSVGTREFFGLVDADNNPPNVDNVALVGRGTRYTLENYIFDPCLIFVHSITSAVKLPPEITPVARLSDFSARDNALLQRVSEQISSYVFGDAPSEFVEVTNWEGGQYRLDVRWAKTPGHELEVLLRSKFSHMGQFLESAQRRLDWVKKVSATSLSHWPRELLESIRDVGRKPPSR
jgi:hypothetical protein